MRKLAVVIFFVLILSGCAVKNPDVDRLENKVDKLENNIDRLVNQVDSQNLSMADLGMNTKTDLQQLYRQDQVLFELIKSNGLVPEGKDPYEK